MGESDKDNKGLLTKENYLSRLSNTDRENLGKAEEAFEAAMRETGKKGALVAVGGTLTKPIPRPDIDLLILLEQEEGDPKREDYQEVLSWYKTDFRLTMDLVSKIVGKSDGLFTIDQAIEPYPDQEHPEIPASDGRIHTKLRNDGTPIEFISSRGRIKNGILPPETTGRPSVVLVKV